MTKTMSIQAFTSDFHFGHANIIKYSERPFGNVYEMREVFIRNYNEVVGPNDTVLWLGDCFFRDQEGFIDAVRRMNGRKLLVLGNHDKSPGLMAGLGFDLVMTECLVHIADRTCRVSHYPYAGLESDTRGKPDRFLERRPKRVKGEVLLHGHTHSKKKRIGNMIHVGVDAWDYRPATFAEVEAIVRQV